MEKELSFSACLITLAAVPSVSAIATVLMTSTIEQAEEASVKPKPKPKPKPIDPPGSGIGDSITGNKVLITPPMDGKIVAIPSINEINSYRMFETASDYSLNRRRLTTGVTRERNSQSRDGYSAGHKWTEYFDVDFDMVVDNLDYAPDAEPGELNSEKYKIEESGGNRNESLCQCNPQGGQGDWRRGCGGRIRGTAQTAHYHPKPAKTTAGNSGRKASLGNPPTIPPSNSNRA